VDLNKNQFTLQHKVHYNTNYFIENQALMLILWKIKLEV